MITGLGSAFAQGETNTSGDDNFHHQSEAERKIAPANRITSKPAVVDTVIPTPDVTYPLLSRKMETSILLNQIDAANIKIVPKLDKLYPGYLRLGIGNYTSPLADFYYNSTRNRRVSYGVHLNHFSSWWDVKNASPRTFDNSLGKVFGEFYLTDYSIETEFDYQNNGYHFYGLDDSLDQIPKDSLANRVQYFSGGFKISNYRQKDSSKLMWTAKTRYSYAHEFQNDDVQYNYHARNKMFMLGSEFKYKQGMNVYKLDFDINWYGYKFAEDDVNLDAADRHNDKNVIVHMRPHIITYGKNWRVLYGADMNIDSPVYPGDKSFKIVPLIEGKYSMFNDILIPYGGITGGVTQHTWYSLNRQNEFMYSGVTLRNTRLFKMYAGIKGTASKNVTFNLQGHINKWKVLPLFINDSTYQGQHRFQVVYDNVDAYGVTASLSYQKLEKLKIDFIGTYNSYVTENELFAWHLPELDLTFRASYNLFEKIYAKADVTVETGRKSPVYLYNEADDNIEVDMPPLIDANLHLEYRYNKRLSAFIQFNNIGAQKYQRWYRYQVQGFQVLGGVTFGF